jgi:hypothetical protein
MTDAKTAAMWLVRMIMLQLGAWMTARGFGDDATWQAVTGGVLALGTMIWSWYATKAQIAAPPPGVPPIVEEIERRARDLAHEMLTARRLGGAMDERKP